MAKSKFSLEQVLELKRRREEQKQLELKARLEQEQFLRAGLEALRARIEGHLDETATRRREGALNAEALEAAVAYLQQLESLVDQQRELLEGSVVRVAECRAELVTALQERRALETLRAKQQAEARLEADRREARETDDITSARYTLDRMQAAEGGAR